MDLKAARRELITRQRRVIADIALAHRKDEHGNYPVPLEEVDKMWLKFDELALLLAKIEKDLKGDYD